MAQAIRDRRVKNRKKLWLQLGIQTNSILRIYILLGLATGSNKSKGDRKNGFGGGAVVMGSSKAPHELVTNSRQDSKYG